jgi:hypothetical protein
MQINLYIIKKIKYKNKNSKLQQLVFNVFASSLHNVILIVMLI